MMPRRRGGNQSSPWFRRETGFPGGASKPADWCRARSCPSPPINLVANLIPVPVFEFLGQPAPAIGYERRQFPGFALPLLREHQAQAFLSQRAESRFFFLRGALRALKQIIRDLNGGLHNMATHIRMDGQPSQAVFDLAGRLKPGPRMQLGLPTGRKGQVWVSQRRHCGAPGALASHRHKQKETLWPRQSWTPNRCGVSPRS